MTFATEAAFERADPSVLDRILEPVAQTMSREQAERLVNLKADSAVQSRLDELADKCTEGALTPDESSEYDT